MCAGGDLPGGRLRLCFWDQGVVGRALMVALGAIGLDGIRGVNAFLTGVKLRVAGSADTRLFRNSFAARCGRPRRATRPGSGPRGRGRLQSTTPSIDFCGSHDWYNLDGQTDARSHCTVETQTHVEPASSWVGRLLRTHTPECSQISSGGRWRSRRCFRRRHLPALCSPMVDHLMDVITRIQRSSNDYRPDQPARTARDSRNCERIDRDRDTNRAHLRPAVDTAGKVVGSTHLDQS